MTPCLSDKEDALLLSLPHSPTPTPSIEASMRKQKGAVGSQSRRLVLVLVLVAVPVLEAGGAAGGAPPRSAVLTKAQLLSAANMFLSVVSGEPCPRQTGTLKEREQKEEKNE
jgi:hypothetical protein